MISRNRETPTNRQHQARQDAPTLALPETSKLIRKGRIRDDSSRDGDRNLIGRKTLTPQYARKKLYTRRSMKLAFTSPESGNNPQQIKKKKLVQQQEQQPIKSSPRDCRAQPKRDFESLGAVIEGLLLSRAARRILQNRRLLSEILQICTVAKPATLALS